MSGSALKAISRELILKNAPKIFFVAVFYMILTSGLDWLIYRLPGTIDFEYMYSRLRAGETPSTIMMYRNFRPFGVVFAAVVYCLIPVINAGYMNYCMKIGRGQDTDYSDILSGFQFVWKVLGIFLLSVFFTFMWSLLLIIPGIVAGYKYRLAYYILLDDPSKSSLQCITESKLMMRGKKADLFIIDLSFFGWYALDVAIVALTPLAFMPRILLIWLAPYRGLVNAGFYEDCKSNIAV